MEGTKFIETIRLENLLSYGPGNEPFPLEPLNVLIGPNGSGKSNLFEALSLLAAVPRDIQEPIRRGGGVRDWLWKGAAQAPTATVDVTIRYPEMPLRYRLSFSEVGGHLYFIDEAIESQMPLMPSDAQPYIYYRYRFQGDRPVIDTVIGTDGNRLQRQLQWDDVVPNQSVLSQRRDSYAYPELTYLAQLFEIITIHGEWYLGHLAPARSPQQADLPIQVLLNDGSNLSLVLSRLLNHPPAKEQVLAHMRDFYPSFRDVSTAIIGGTVQVFFHEEDLRHPIPATRLSDGCLRYLCLLAVLCDPTLLPRIICIEEPELGLHPDVIPEVAKLLIEASSRSQIFVTTHSDVLVDALTGVPEAVIVCEKFGGATQLRRLDAEKLQPWLEEYRLGEIWTRGEIGGNRW